jgi:hypothetical protein
MNETNKKYLSIFNEINPIQQSVHTIERLIRLLTLVFGIFSVYMIYREFSGIVFLFSKGITFWGSETAMYYLPLILLLLATFLFWVRLKVGWVTMCIYLTYSIIRNFGFLIIYWDIDPFGTILLDSIFPRITPIFQVLTILIYGVGFWIIVKKETLEKFNITRKIIFLTTGVSAFLTFLFQFPSYAKAFFFWFIGGE